MNLLAKSLGRVVMFTIALFFFSCEDESSFVGFKNPNKKFDVSHVELNLETSVLSIDSVISDYFGTVTSATNTSFHAVGEYNDPIMGSMRAETYLQYRPSETAIIDQPDSMIAVYDSLTIHLRLNYYSYGFTGSQKMEFNLHEITASFGQTERRYYTNSNVPYNPNPIGKASTYVDRASMDTLTQDTTLFINGKLSDEYGARLFDIGLNKPEQFADYGQFIQEMKGVVITPAQGNGILGINILSSVMLLHYHTIKVKDASVVNKLSRSFIFSTSRLKSYPYPPSFTNYIADRSGTEFSDITQSYQPVRPGSGLRAVQSGSPLITKIDLTEFYNFIESEGLENTLINSAELVISDVHSTPGIELNTAFKLRVINNNNNRFTRNNNESLQYLRNYYVMGTSFFNENDEGQFHVRSESNPSFEATLDYNKDEAELACFMSTFVQTLFRNSKNKDGSPNQNRITYLGLLPHDPPEYYGPTLYRSVNRTVFNASNVKLRINYTKPASVDNNNN